MLVLSIVLGVLLLLLLILLYGLINPITVLIDSRAETIRLTWKGIGSVWVLGEMSNPVIRIRMLGWQKNISLLDLRGSSKKKELQKEKKARNRSWKRPDWLTFQLIVRLLKTFQIQQLRLDLDTRDYLQNAYWYPVFWGLSRGNRQFRINFQGKSELVLVITNHPWRLVWVLGTGFISSKTYVS